MLMPCPKILENTTLLRCKWRPRVHGTQGKKKTKKENALSKGGSSNGSRQVDHRVVDESHVGKYDVIEIGLNVPM
jgi:hypothetical protein